MQVLLLIIALTVPFSQSGTLYKDTDGPRLKVDNVGSYKLDIPQKSLEELWGEQVNVSGDYQEGGVIKNPIVCWSFYTHEEVQMVRWANFYRALHGLRPLIPDRALQITANRHCYNMRHVYGFRHGGTGGWAGENIAQGQPNPENVTRTWYNSPGHRANLLNPNFTRIGVGGYSGFWTQQFR